MNLMDASLFRKTFPVKFRSFSPTAAGAFACNSMGIVASAMFSGRSSNRLGAAYRLVVLATVWIAKSLKFVTFVGLDSEAKALNS